MGNHKGFDRLGWFLFGVGVGVALGILFAPDKGEVTRQKLKEKIKELGEKLKRFKEKVEQKGEEFMSVENQGGKDALAEEERAKAEELMEEVMSLYSEIKRLKEEKES